jgi:NADPH:quinone reductase-like Zn-dependent oxidoreductase
MKAIVVTEPPCGTPGMKLAERREPEPARQYVVGEAHAAGNTSGEPGWPSTWINRLGRHRARSIRGHEMAGVVTAIDSGTTALRTSG